MPGADGPGRTRQLHLVRPASASPRRSAEKILGYEGGPGPETGRLSPRVLSGCRSIAVGTPWAPMCPPLRGTKARWVITWPVPRPPRSSISHGAAATACRAPQRRSRHRRWNRRQPRSLGAPRPAHDDGLVARQSRGALGASDSSGRRPPDGRPSRRKGRAPPLAREAGAALSARAASCRYCATRHRRKCPLPSRPPRAGHGIVTAGRILRYSPLRSWLNGLGRFRGPSLRLWVVAALEPARREYPRPLPAASGG